MTHELVGQWKGFWGSVVSCLWVHEHSITALSSWMVFLKLGLRVVVEQQGVRESVALAFGSLLFVVRADRHDCSLWLLTELRITRSPLQAHLLDASKERHTTIRGEKGYFEGKIWGINCAQLLHLCPCAAHAIDDI